MKTVIAIVAALFTTAAQAQTCEETIAKSEPYASTFEALEALYEDASWLQKKLVKHQQELEIEAICDVKLGRGKKSEHWTIKGTIQDESYFHLLIDLYDL